MGSKSKYKIGVIVPAYNESAVISDVINKAEKIFSKSGYTIDIIIVNDGSRDDTSKAARSTNVIVIDHILNSGAGAATLTGLSFAKNNDYKIVATMDADGQHAPEDVLKGIDIMYNDKNSDLLIGSRLIDNEGMGTVKVLGNKGLSAITYMLFGTGTTDSQSGLRIYSRKAIDELKWQSSGYEFCSEMLWRAKQQKLIINEYPIEAIYTDYSKGKGQSNWNAFNIISSLLKRRLSELFNE